MIVLDSSGAPLSLGSTISEGGEGRIYNHPINPELLVKVYKTPSASRSDKNQALVKFGASAGEKLHRMTAWPQQLVFSAADQESVGFIMKKVPGDPIHAFYSPKERKESYPTFTWLNLIRIAKNTAAAFHHIHSSGVIMGDVNESNILIDPSTGFASLIDCDSYQIRLHGQTFRCHVGVGPWTPPELHYARFDQIDRTTDHDLFGLAILIFQLLFMGRHPYASEAESDLTQAIKKHLFSYSDILKSKGLRQPTNTLTREDVASDLFSLFERAFLAGSSLIPSSPRATADEWFTSLSKMEERLTECKLNTLHFHLANHECPFCRLDRAGNPVFNLRHPGSSAVTMTADQVDTQIWNQIKLLSIPAPSSPAQLIPPKGRPIPLGTTRFNFEYIGFGLIGIIFLLIIIAIGVYAIGLAILFGRLFFALIKQRSGSQSSFANLRMNRLIALQEAQADVAESLKLLDRVTADRNKGLVELKTRSEACYANLKEISRQRMGSYLNPETSVSLSEQLGRKQKVLQDQLRMIHKEAVELCQKAAKDITRIEKDHRINIESLLQAAADFQVIQKAEKDGSGLSFPEWIGPAIVALLLVVFVGFLVFKSQETSPLPANYTVSSSFNNDSLPPSAPISPFIPIEPLNPPHEGAKPPPTLPPVKQ